jgi:O-antigen ligase
VKAIANRSEIRFILLAALFISSMGSAIITDQWALSLIPFIFLAFYAGWLNRNFLFLALMVTIPFSFEFHFSSSLGTDIPDEALMALVSYIFLAAWTFSPSLLSKKTLQHPLLMILGALLCWTVVATIFSLHPLISFKFLLAKAWYIGAFVLAALIIFKEEKNITAAALLLLAAMFIVVSITMARHAFNGFRFANINNSLFPFFRNHVNYAAMLVCLLPIAGAAYHLSGEKYRRVIIAVIAIFLVGLFFSFSRGAWLALMVGMLAAWLITRRKLLLAYIASVIITAIAVSWISNNDRYLQFAPDFKTTIFHKDFSEHWIATYKLKDVSTAERFYRWVAGVRMIKDKALTGYGPNSFYDEYKPYALPVYKTWVSDNPEHSTVHNYFLLTAIEQGLPGLLFLLILFGAMIYYAEKNYFRSADKFNRTVSITTGVIIAMLLVLNFLSDLIETDKIGSLFFLCIATLICIDRSNKLPARTPPDSYRDF